MLKGVVIGLISSGIIVAVLAAIYTEPVEPWLMLAGLLACLGVVVAVVAGLWRILVRATRWARDELSWRYCQLERRIRQHPPLRTMGAGHTPPRPPRPFWQSEAAYEMEQQEAEALEAQQYMPRVSTRLASVRIVRPSAAESRERPRPQAQQAATVETPVSGDPQGPMRQEEEPHRQAVTWVPPGATIEIMGHTIKGGMFHVGDEGHEVRSRPDSALIDLSREVDWSGDYRQPLPAVPWPSYAGLTPAGRGAHLRWLEDGRSAPDADIGHVFLFFYGLERRVLIDGQHDVRVQAEFPKIATEIERLLGIYGGSLPFRRHANQLLGVIVALSPRDDYHLKPLPPMAPDRDLPLYLRIVLGQGALAGQPLPAETALAWVRHSPDISLRTPALHCPGLFELAFGQRYRQRFPEGLKLPVNRSRLRHDYHAASPALARLDIRLDLGELPDVAVLTAPIRQLGEVVDLAIDDISAYSRYIAKNPAEAGEMDALLLLPEALWPSQVRQCLFHLRDRLHDGAWSTSLRDLWRRLRLRSAMTRPRLLEILSVLAGQGMLMVPDVLSGARMPRPDEPVVLFEAGIGHDQQTNSPAFQAALLTMHLAASVAAADEAFNASELEQLLGQLAVWTHLSDSERRRLQAHVRLMRQAPQNLASLNHRFRSLNLEAKEAIARFLVMVACADEQVSSAELRILQRSYRALGLDSSRVFGDVHRAQSSQRRGQERHPPGVLRQPGEEVPASGALHSADDSEGTAGAAGVAGSSHESSAEDAARVLAQTDPADTVKPDQRPSAQRRSDDSYPLNWERVSEIDRQTRDVASILGSIFGERDDRQERHDGLSAPTATPAAGQAEPGGDRVSGEPLQAPVVSPGGGDASPDERIQALAAVDEPYPSNELRDESEPPVAISFNPSASNLLGLDGLDDSLVHFVHALLKQRVWHREELEALAADLDLMLDGALEQLNDACFDRYDIPLLEGDDPLEINPDILEKVQATLF